MNKERYHSLIILEVIGVSVKRMSTSVAGTKYRNDDGSSRQEAVSRLQERDQVRLKPTYYGNEEAVEVWTSNNNPTLIGYLYKDLARDFFYMIKDGLVSGANVREIRQNEDGYLECGLNIFYHDVDTIQQDAPIQRPAQPYPSQARVCPRCRSNNVQIQAVNEIKLKTARKGILWWIFVGWWWMFIKWLILTVPALIFKLFGTRKQKAVNTTVTMAICQNCGESWELHRRRA